MCSSLVRSLSKLFFRYELNDATLNALSAWLGAELHGDQRHLHHSRRPDHGPCRHCDGLCAGTRHPQARTPFPAGPWPTVQSRAGPPPPVAQAQYSRFFRYQNADGPYVAALTPLVTYVGSDGQMGVTPGAILCACACRTTFMRPVSELAFDFKAAATTTGFSYKSNSSTPTTAFSTVPFFDKCYCASNTTNATSYPNCAGFIQTGYLSGGSPCQATGRLPVMCASFGHLSFVILLTTAGSRGAERRANRLSAHLMWF